MNVADRRLAAFGPCVTCAGPLPPAWRCPCLKDVLIDLGWFYLPFAMPRRWWAPRTPSTLTDGLDGLGHRAGDDRGSCFGFIAISVGNVIFADYLQLTHRAGAGELAVFCGALIGAGLGFLWFNAPPAMVFMGDTGSLSMGGALGAISGGHQA